MTPRNRAAERARAARRTGSCRPWPNGEATAIADFGDPLATDTYDFCIYEDGISPPSLRFAASAPPGGICHDLACWRLASTAYRYSDAERTPDGLKRIVLKAGSEGRAKITVRARGERLTPDGFPLPPPGTPLKVQLQASSGACFEAVFPPGVRKNR